LLRQRRFAVGIDLGTTIKYLQQTTSGAAVIGLGTAAKYMRRTTSAAAGNGLGTTQTTCAAPRATTGQIDHVPATHNKRRRRQRPGHHDK
jgi:hypothetical protein